MKYDCTWYIFPRSPCETTSASGVSFLYLETTHNVVPFDFDGIFCIQWNTMRLFKFMDSFINQKSKDLTKLITNMIQVQLLYCLWYTLALYHKQKIWQIPWIWFWFNLLQFLATPLSMTASLCRRNHNWLSKTLIQKIKGKLHSMWCSSNHNDPALSINCNETKQLL